MNKVSLYIEYEKQYNYLKDNYDFIYERITQYANNKDIINIYKNDENIFNIRYKGIGSNNFYKCIYLYKFDIKYCDILTYKEIGMLFYKKILFNVDDGIKIYI